MEKEGEDNNDHVLSCALRSEKRDQALAAIKW